MTKFKDGDLVKVDSSTYKGKGRVMSTDLSLKYPYDVKLSCGARGRFDDTELTLDPMFYSISSNMTFTVPQQSSYTFNYNSLSTAIKTCTYDELEWMDNLPDPKPKGCSHNWKNYVGLTEVYNYCTKCDKKDGHI